jgi:hypothetical protein
MAGRLAPLGAPDSASGSLWRSPTTQATDERGTFNAGELVEMFTAVPTGDIFQHHWVGPRGCAERNTWPCGRTSCPTCTWTYVLVVSIQRP